MTQRAVIFDLGVVLSSPEGVYESIASVLGTSVDAVMAGYWGPHRRRYDEGSPDREFWAETLGLTDGVGDADVDSLLPALVAADTTEWGSIRTSARAILTGLRAEARPVYVLSNAPKSFAEAATGFEWYDLVDRFFFSGKLGVSKPSPEIYAHVEREIGLPPEALWFIDDRVENVTTASARGWHAHLWVDDADTRRWLCQEGFLS